MLEKLKALELRYEDLQNQLGDPKVYSDSERLRQVNRELKELSPIAETYRAYIAADSRKKESEELLHDPDLKEMAQEELLEAKAELESLKEKLTILLLPKDPDDGRNVVLEIRAGTGGEEEALFAHAPASVGKRGPCLPPTSCGCTPCMPKAVAGSWKSPASMKRSLAE